MADAKTGARTKGKSKLNWAATAKSLGMADYGGVGGEDKCVAGDELIDINLTVAHGDVFSKKFTVLSLYDAAPRNISSSHSEIPRKSLPYKLENKLYGEPTVLAHPEIGFRLRTSVSRACIEFTGDAAIFC